MKTMKKFVCILALGLASSSSWAWGDREQGVLQGLAGAWLLGRILQQPEAQPVQPPAYIPPPVYVAPPPPVYYHRPVCYHVPYYDSWGRVAYYRQVCR